MNEVGRDIDRLVGHGNTYSRDSALGGFAHLAADWPDLALDLPILREDGSPMEKFGEESSYWTIFNMFCSEGRAGAEILSVEEIWDILSAEYDMSEETYPTLYQTLKEFTKDINEDALDRGLDGRFVETEPAFFAFAIRVSINEAISTD